MGRRGSAHCREVLDERQLGPRRGDVVGVTLPTREGEARKLAVVVSSDAINRAGMHAIVARLTKEERHRALPTVVVVEPEEQTGLQVRSFILCHDIVTVPQASCDPQRKGTLPLGKLIEVEHKLRYALDLLS